MYKTRETLETGKIAMRDACIDALVELAKDDPRIVLLDIDCMHSMGTSKFAKAYPDRYFNCGIQECNAVGVAAGMSAEGMIPFINAFGVFATRRPYDQVFLSCGYAKLNVKIIGWDAGISATSNGGTHMPFEDAGIMRGVPGMTVLETSDTTSFSSLVREAANMYGNVYIRTFRKDVTEIYEPDTKLTIGKGAVLREGTDVSILASGMMVKEALIAEKSLRELGVSAKVVDMHTIKPLDEECVLECAKQTGAIVVAQNHNYINGLYSAVAECTAAKCPVPLERVCVEDEFGEVGSFSYLQNRFGLTAERIVKKALDAVSRK